MRKAIKEKVLFLLLFLMLGAGCERFARGRDAQSAPSQEMAQVDSVLRACANYFLGGQSVQLRQGLDEIAPLMESYRNGGQKEQELYLRYLRSQLTYYAQFTNQYDSMLYYAGETKRMALATGDNRAAINAMSNMGDILRQKGDVVGAAGEYRQALWLNDSTEQEPELYLAIHCGLGCTYIVLRNLDKAEQILLNMKQWQESMQLVDSISYYQLLGNCYYYKKDYARSLTYFMALDSLLATHPEMEFDYHACQVNICDIYIQQGKDELLGNKLQQAEHYFLTGRIDACLPYIHTLQIQHLLGMGRKEEALACANRYQSDLQGMNPDHKISRYATLVNCMKAAGEYAQALNYEEQRIALSDSLRSQQIQAMVDEIEQRYSYNMEIVKQEYETQRQKLWTASLWVALVLVSLLAFAMAFGLVIWHRKVHIEREMAMNKIISLRHQIIHNRITPHFISNALSLGEQLSQEDISSIIYLIKDALAQEHKPAVDLYEEIELVKSYVNVASRISSRKILFRMDDVAPSVLKSVMVPSMSLLILVENAIKHGAAAQDGLLHITLNITSSAHDMVLRLKNGGTLGEYHACNDSAMHGLRMLGEAIALTNRHTSASQRIAFDVHDTQDGCVESIIHIIYNIS